MFYKINLEITPLDFTKDKCLLLDIILIENNFQEFEPNVEWHCDQEISIFRLCH